MSLHQLNSAYKIVLPAPNNTTHLRHISCEDVRQMELTWECVQWWVLVFVVLHLSVLLPEILTW
jgi:hypothetical protein